MKLIGLLFIVLFFCGDCKSKEPLDRVEKDVTIKFNVGAGDVACGGEWCGTTLEIVGGENNLKSKTNLPDSIVNKWEYWNREYLATLQFLDETCICKNGDAEPYPPGSNNFPQVELSMVKILEIREK